jgi:hypothetical protein
MSHLVLGDHTTDPYSTIDLTREVYNINKYFTDMTVPEGTPTKYRR